MKIKLVTAGLLCAMSAMQLQSADYAGYVSLRGTGVDAIYAFMTNVADLAKGWSDERDPHKDADYVLESSSRLATPDDSSSSTCYEFPGRSLTIDTAFDAKRGLLFATCNDASVKFKTLKLRGGCIDQKYSSKAQTIRGDVVVDLSDKKKPFRIRGGTEGQSWHFREGALSSGCDDILETAVDYSTKSVSYWVHDNMDASAFAGTFRVWWSKTLHVECPRFGGIVEAAPTGTVSFAANNVSISNVLLSAAYARLTFDLENLSCGVDCLVMTNDTTVAFLSGDVLTVGDLDYCGGKIDFTNGGLLSLTNGYAMTSPIQIEVHLASTAKRSPALVTLPVAAGELRAEDFTCQQIAEYGCQYQFRVSTENGLQSLYLENLLPYGTTYSSYQNSDDYVHQIAGGYSGSAIQNVFAADGAWSNRMDGVSVAVPTSDDASDLDYEGVRLGFWGGQDVDFKGRSFTYSGYPVRATGNATTYSFPDIRVISGTSQSYWPTFYCTAVAPNITIRGMMTVLCTHTDSYPLRICPSNKDNNKYGVYNLEAKFVGDSTRYFRLCDFGETADVGEVTNVVRFTGDMSAYAGTIAARKNVRMSLGGAATELPGTLLLEDASARLTLDGISATVGTIRTTAASMIEIPEGKTLMVSDSLDLADGTTIAMTAGESALDLSSCGSLNFGGTVHVPITMDADDKKVPVAVAGDNAAAESVAASFRAMRNGRTPMRLVPEDSESGVVIYAVVDSPLIIIIK